MHYATEAILLYGITVSNREGKMNELLIRHSMIKTIKNLTWLRKFV